MKPCDILVVEDEPKIAELIVDFLQEAGFTVVLASNATQTFLLLKHIKPNLILLDVMLPDESGFAVCEQVRQYSQTPIIILSAKSQEEDRLQGFEMGADDYICKPFSYKELVFRIKAILKRAGPRKIAESKRQAPTLDIDASAYAATLNGINLELTAHEFRILSALADSPNRVFSREMLLAKAYSESVTSNDRAVDSHIKNLRKKLRAADPSAKLVKSVYGVGYKLTY